ncbi:DUF1702 family protein [Actinomycetospora aeridis]|uniref:DUF1702 family protein n=1 Tax=Actinomycetospora aeridis TaxID=3129231 RepID=A0ABU8N091_9PSEU
MLTWRRRLLTPSHDETRLATRGFHVKDAAAKEVLETVGARFLDGFGEAVGTRTVAELEEYLETVPTRFRGFAAEGAAMGLAVLDALPMVRSGRVDTFLGGRGRDHVYMALVGVGWAMARLPRLLWPRPDRFDPLLRWLVLDGYGFHQAYFHTDDWVHGDRRRPVLDWARDDAAYEGRAIDQGIGRALWFVAGTDARRAADLVDAYPEHRRADLWGGIGLAATYAGGATTEELEHLVTRSGPYRADLAQGSAFAAEARLRAGLEVPHVGAATAVLAGTDPVTAARVCEDTRPVDGADGAERPGEPAYETWRRHIGQALTTGRLTAPTAPTGGAR